jgi:hypothetical protein
MDNLAEIPHDIEDDISVLSDSESELSEDSASDHDSDDSSITELSSESESESSESESDGSEAPTAKKVPMALKEFYDMHNRQRVTIADEHPFEIKVYRRKEGKSGPKRSYQLVSTNADGKGLYKMISRNQASELGYPKNASFA